MSTHSIKFRPDLQGLRAIAVTLVILGHAGVPYFPGGFIGVDVFFVLSGYLITGLLLRELDQNSGIDLVSFYARRLKRLFPALGAMLFVSSGFAVWQLSDWEVRSQLASFPYAATWTSNLYFTFTNFDYFNELATKDLFLHTWSLGVEEQFYLIWPALLLLFSLKRMEKNCANSRLNRVLIGIFIAFVASFLLSVYWTMEFPHAAFYLMPARIWQFSLGALVYVASKSHFVDTRNPFEKSKEIIALIMLIVGIGVIIGAGMLLHPNLAYPGFWALLPSIGAALIIAAGQVKGSNQLLAHPAFVWVGDRSYSLYLWHWPILLIGFAMGWQGQVIPTACMVLLTVLAAIISYRIIEIPFWRGQWSNVKPNRVILISVLIMATSVLGAYQKWREPLGPQPGVDKSSQWRRDAPILYQLGCDAWYANAEVLSCAFEAETQEKSEEKTVVLLGDSIGVQWFSMIREVFPVARWKVVVFTKSSCPMVDEDFYYARIGKVYKVCRDWRDATLKAINLIKPNVLIMGNAATYDFNRTQWIKGSERIIEKVRNPKTSIIIIPGTPSLGFDGPSCVSRNLSSEGRIDPNKCLAKGRGEIVESVAGYLQQAADQFANVHMLNLNDVVCPDGNCNAINKQGLVVFRDSQHLTDSYVRAITPIIRERVQSLFVQDELSTIKSKRSSVDPVDQLSAVDGPRQ